MDSDDPVIRYRTYHELSINKDESLEPQLRKELLKSSIVQKWVHKLEYTKEQIKEFLTVDDKSFMWRFWTLFHGSKNTCAENYLYKLQQLGLDSSFTEYDNLVIKIIPALDKAKNHPPKFLHNFASRLFSGIGYYSHVKEYYKRRFQLLTETIQKTDYDIYLNPEEATFKFPSKYSHALVKSEYIIDDQLTLPQTYDLFAFTHLRSENDEFQIKIDKIVETILDERYQQLKQGFGYGLYSNGRVYGIGYKVSLPGFFEFNPSEITSDFLIKVFLMSHLPSVTQHKWFKQCIEYLENHKTNQGIYKFPAKIMKEGTSGYFIKGAYMGLCQNRRLAISKELESTFWMMKIKKNARLD